MKIRIAFLFCFFAATSDAQWQVANGPAVQNVPALAVADSKIITGAGYLSSDSGKTWTNVTGENISFAVNGTTIVSGNDSGIISLSTDTGYNWTVISGNIPNLSIWALAISGTNIFAGTDNGIFLTNDTGQTWVQKNTGLTDTTIKAIAVMDSNILVGTGDGVFLSTNNGNSWVARNNGLTASINTIVVKGTKIYASTTTGVYFSIDTGLTWISISTSLTWISSIVINGTTIFAGTYNGIFLSSDTGTVWTAANNGLSDKEVFSLGMIGTTLIAGTYTVGIYLSSDNGNTWRDYNQGTSKMGVQLLGIDGPNIFAYAEQWAPYAPKGGYISKDSCKTWTHLSSNGVPLTTFFYDFARLGSKFYGHSGASNTVCQSQDSGYSWTCVNSISGAVRTVFASGSNLFAGTQGHGVYLSIDSGITWTHANNGLANDDNLRFASIDSNLFVIDNQYGVFVTTDNGNNWVPKNNGLTNLAVYRLFVHGTDLFAGTAGGVNGGIFKSSDTANTWSLVMNIIYEISSFTASGSTIFAGSWNTGVYVSTDGGNNWVPINNGLTDLHVECLAIIGDTIFAGTLYSPGFFKRSVTEILLSLGISENNKYDFTIYPNPTTHTFTIKNISSNKTSLLQIINPIGEIVYTEKLFGRNEYLVNANLKKGIYFVRISDGEKNVVRKLVVE